MNNIKLLIYTTIFSSEGIGRFILNLINNFDLKKLSKKIISLLNNKNKLSKKNNKAYKRALEYNISKVIKEYENLFLQVVGE